MDSYGENDGYVALAKYHLKWTRKVEWFTKPIPLLSLLLN